MHLILTSRADPALPLARLRVRGQLTELRAADLRFTLDEAAAFFQQVKALSLPAAQIEELETRTEGWGAGLQLAALSLEHPLPGGYSPTGETGCWRGPTGVVSYRLVDPNNKTETTIDGNGLKALTSRCNMVPASV
jgi:hypothetical protein